MDRAPRRLAAVIGMAAMFCISAAAGAQETVSFQTDDYKSWADYFGNRPSAHPTIDGKLFLPPGTGRVPAVVIMHGGTGITAAESGAAQRLMKAGFAAFLVDRARGRGIIVGPGRPLRIHIASQFADAMNALHAMAKQPRIDPARVGILGYSLGGAQAVGLTSTRLLGPYANLGVRYAAHVGVYPICALTSSQAGTGTGAPLLILVGSEDRVTPANNCKELVELRRVADPKAKTELIEYAGAEHGWENTETPRHTRSGQFSIEHCPIFSVDSADTFSLHSADGVRKVAADDYYAVVKRCIDRPETYAGYFPEAAEKSTAAWLKFFAENLQAMR